MRPCIRRLAFPRLPCQTGVCGVDETVASGRLEGDIGSKNCLEPQIDQDYTVFLTEKLRLRRFFVLARYIRTARIAAVGRLPQPLDDRVRDSD